MHLVVPWIARHTHMFVGAPTTQRKLHHMGFADDDGACCFESLG